MSEEIDKRRDTIAQMLKDGSSIADIMERARVAYVTIKRIRDDLGILPNRPGPRLKADEATNDWDRKLYSRQSGQCWFCLDRLLDWTRLADRKGTAAALVCKLCLRKWTPIIWDDVAFKNAEALRALNGLGGILKPQDVGGRYKGPDGPKVYSADGGKTFFLYIGEEKSVIEEKFIWYPF